MRFPSLDFLATRALAVLRRFPWTLAAGGMAAASAIAASSAYGGDRDPLIRTAFVAALALPLTIALTLLAEARHWRPTLRTAALAAGVLALAAFGIRWRGIDATHDMIRYFQLSAAVHLGVAFLPLLGAAESIAFWQYNRRLFLSFLRAVVFSGVLFVGIAIALAALDRLFGVKVNGETYFRIWLIVALVVNTWIFLAAVPEDVAALEHDTEYPRALKVFAQYILTPLAFTYLIILLAYLVKIVVGGEWPSGWIGWLVASVSVTGLLGFLLVHPLRTDPNEGWIRTYARWLFVGLMPAALMLLVAFWKRIVPYGLTEPRVLGILLGLWLLGVALLFTLRSAASIRTIPVSLAALLLLTLYGPLSLTHIAISSQGRRLAAMLAKGSSASENAREASAALRFLIDRRAADEIAARIGHELPPIDWELLPRHGPGRDTVGRRIMALAGATYVPEYLRGNDGWFYLTSDDRMPLPIAPFDWMLLVMINDTTTHVAGADTVRVLTPSVNGIARIRAGADTLEFDLRPLARRYADSVPGQTFLTGERRRVEAAAGGRRGVLAVGQLNGRRTEDSVVINHWSGWVLLGGDSAGRRGDAR